MLHTRMARRGMVTAPHHLAAQSGAAILREGGNAVEAMVAMAATIAVVYPHMNSIGGDGFWLIHEPGQKPVGIEACGGAAALATPEWYRNQGFSAIPERGGPAALTVAGAVAGWRHALGLAAPWGQMLPLQRLLEDAVHYARDGVPVSRSHAHVGIEKRAQLLGRAPFEAVFAHHGEWPETGQTLRQPALAETLNHLGNRGLGTFYDGELAGKIAADLESAGSPLRASDLAGFRARLVEPIQTRAGGATVFNMPPPTQGLASLLILALYDRMVAREADSFDYVHRLVEATKRAFTARDTIVTDPAYAKRTPQSALTEDALAARAALIDPARAAPWPLPADDMGDTVWMGAIDGEGRAVSYIQSIFWEFGSGVVLPETGITWQNRGIVLGLDEASRHPVRAGRKPFHTLNPALALFDDGRVLSYGTMGGEGQPQTQAVMFTRYAHHGLDLQAAITAPRWLLGRTWGSATTSLKVEAAWPQDLVARLRAAGHAVEIIPAFAETVGHAGAVLRHPDGTLEGATDPRSDGAVAGF